MVDCTVEPPLVLRPGPVTIAQLEQALSAPVDPHREMPDAGPARSPGQLARHYAPRTPLELPAHPADRVAALLAAGKRVGWLTATADAPDTRRLAASRDLVIVPMPTDPDAYATMLYAALHALDKRDISTIVVDLPADTDVWRAVRDRLTRAASA